MTERWDWTRSPLTTRKRFSWPAPQAYAASVSAEETAWRTSRSMAIACVVAASTIDFSSRAAYLDSCEWTENIPMALRTTQTTAATTAARTRLIVDSWSAPPLITRPSPTPAACIF